MDCSTPIPRSTSRLRRGVRVIGKVRPCTNPDAAAGAGDGFFVAAVARSDGEHATVSFTDRSTGVLRRDTYKLDWCYDKDEGVGEIFVKEVKPLIHGLFRGSNACVIAYGARGSGKTQLIQGSVENLGLVSMAMLEVLELSEGIGGTVSISLYEVRQDHIFDLLEPKEQEVVVLEDAERRIQLRGLSKVTVRTIQEFGKFYPHERDKEKRTKKVQNEAPSRGHQGLIIYVSSSDKQDQKDSLVAKINFLDLAGYEEAKPKSNGRFPSVEGAKINKSLYGLMNVLCALNSNESFVPCRENKLTRILQDSLCKTSKSVLIACMEQISCQDTIHAVNLASRSSQVVNQHRYSLAINSKSSSRPITSSIKRPDALTKNREQTLLTGNTMKSIRTPSFSNKRPHPQGQSTKKPGTSISSSIKMKEADFASALRGGRKLFSPTPSTNTLKECESDIPTTTVTPSEEIGSSIGKEIEVPLSDEGCDVPDDVANVVASDTMLEVDDLTSHEQIGFSSTDVGEILSADISGAFVESTPTGTDESSPKLSEKLKEISNSLKLLSVQPINIEAPKVDTSCVREVSGDPVEPKTPGVPFKFEHVGTPQDVLKARSTGLKKSLVKECLTFLNSANKEQLKGLKGIGDKRATYILQLREETPEPFKDTDDLKDIGLSSKQIRKMMSGIMEDA